MICLNCLKAGQENKANHLKRAANLHDKCDYKGCVCQHKTGTGHTKASILKEQLTPTQSRQVQSLPTLVAK